MSDDIVDRLWEGVWYHGGEVRVLLKPAAEEIERLRDERERLRDGIAQALTELDAEPWCPMCEDGKWPCVLIEHQEAEIKRLRALIEDGDQ